MKNPVGSPPKYRSKKEIEGLIEQYFKDCQGTVITDDDGNAITDKYGKPMIMDAHPPTVSGLALALGFNSRQSLLNYQGKPEFADTITRAKSRIEEYTESRLFDRDGSNGARFSLTNNFAGWSEKQEVNSNNTNVNTNTNNNLNTDLTALSKGEREKRIAELLAKRSK